MANAKRGLKSSPFGKGGVDFSALVQKAKETLLQSGDDVIGRFREIEPELYELSCELQKTASRKIFEYEEALEAAAKERLFYNGSSSTSTPNPYYGGHGTATRPYVMGTATGHEIDLGYGKKLYESIYQGVTYQTLVESSDGVNEEKKAKERNYKNVALLNGYILGQFGGKDE